jgi:hypothetical protein
MIFNTDSPLQMPTGFIEHRQLQMCTTEAEQYRRQNAIHTITARAADYSWTALGHGL